MQSLQVQRYPGADIAVADLTDAEALRDVFACYDLDAAGFGAGVGFEEGGWLF